MNRIRQVVPILNCHFVRQGSAYGHNAALQGVANSLHLKTSVQDLPAEIHAGIASNLTQQETLNLCLTSQTLNSRCLSVLYRTVDLSLHHDSRLNNSLVERIYDNPRKLMKAHEERVLAACYCRRMMFLQVLSHIPERVQWVQSLRWTILASDLECLRDNESVRCTENTCVDQKGQFQLPILFSLKNVKHIDLAHGPMDNQTEMLAPPDNVHLFPNAISIQLCGTMGRSLIGSILHPDKLSKIKHLNLDDLQVLTQEPVRFVDTPRKVGVHKTASLFGLLTQMKDRGTALRSLTIRIPWSDGMHHCPASIFPFILTPYDQFYAELAAFLDCVRGSLEIFVLDRYRHPIRDSQPDPQCGVSLFPVLTSGTWPRLCILCMNTGQAPNRAYPNRTLEQVRLALGPNVKCMLPSTDSLAPWSRAAQAGDVLERIRVVRK